MKRRELLGAISAVTIGATPLGATAFMPEQHGRIGRTDVARLQQTVVRLYRLDYRHGGESLWQTAIVEADYGLAMLERGSCSEAVGRLLLQVTGRMRMCAGWLAFDAGHQEIARSCYNEALSLARQADDREVETHALANLAFQSNALGRPREAIRFATAAERCAAADGVPARLGVVPQFRRAIGAAMSGDASDSDRAIKKARLIFDGEGAIPTAEWLSFVSPVEIDGIEATCATELGRTKRAEQLLERAIAGHDDRYARNRALYRVRLARARLDAHAIDGAAEAARDALDDFGDDVASWRAAAELNSAVDRLARHPSVAGVDAVLARHAASATRTVSPLQRRGT